MSETLFAFDERNYRECQGAFRGDNNQEYYLGEYCIDSGADIDVRADRKTVGSCSIIRLRSNTRLFFRRSWAHIREDATDVTVLWFVKRGKLGVGYQSGGKKRVATAGDFVITKSMSPFTIECEPDEDRLHEVLHVVVPTHIFRRHFSYEVNTGFPVPAQGREFLIAERILNDVFDNVGLSEHVEQRLLDSVLSVLTDAVKDCEGFAQVRQSLSEKRLQDVIRFIEIHLSDPKLNAVMVAEACGISSRYLSHLLRQHGVSFSTLVWDWRLKAAHQWLSSTEAGDISIAEIAFGVGFKSPAHFSRLFKRVYRQGPREFRAGKQQEISCRQDVARHRHFYAGSPQLMRPLQ